MGKYAINIAMDFSKNLGGRWKKLGPYSGEAFFEEILEKKYLEAKHANEVLHIFLDGASPYGSSFLDQSFGTLYRKYGKEVVDTVCFRTEYFGWIVDFIKTEIWK